MPGRPVVRKQRKARKPRVNKVSALSVAEKKQVKAIVKGTMETKRATWYSSFNNGTVPDRADGKYGSAGWANQNNYISNNNTDILRLVPNVVTGTDDFTRIGTRLVVSSLIVKGQVRVTLSRQAAFAATDIRVVIFVLQHKQLKDYETLYANNQFAQLLDTNEGSLVPFAGQPTHEDMRVADQYYTVCHKKIITLRYAGSTVNNPTADLAIANSHNYYGKFSMNLTKNLPKNLRFPEIVTQIPPDFANAPTNSSLFMSMGFVDQNSTAAFVGTPEPVKGWMQQCYTSVLSFKDA